MERARCGASRSRTATPREGRPRNVCRYARGDVSQTRRELRAHRRRRVVAGAARDELHRLVGSLEQSLRQAQPLALQPLARAASRPPRGSGGSASAGSSRRAVARSSTVMPASRLRAPPVEQRAEAAPARRRSASSTYCAWPPARKSGITSRRATVAATSTPWSSATRWRQRSIPAAVPAEVMTRPSAT